MMNRRKRWISLLLVALLVGGASMAYVGWRAKRTYTLMKDWRAQVRHLVESGGTIGDMPAVQTFAPSYLEAVFGSDPELLNQLKVIIAKGVAEDPAINLGEVTAMIVTYSRDPQGKAERVAAHVLGGFDIGKRRPGFHRDGFFAAQLDPNLLNSGSAVLSLLGRDMLVFADPRIAHEHDELLESVLSGDIIPLVGVLTNRSLYFTAVFPDPKRVLPMQLRPHIQACIFKGRLEPNHGEYETQFLTRDPRSANYALSVVQDMKIASMLALKSRFGGGERMTPWGASSENWWANAMVKTVDDTVLQKQENIVTLKTSFERIMVNASLKALERMGRDMSQMRLVMDDKLDPRLADKQLTSGRPLNYWGKEHRWGPNWPMAPVSSNGTPAAPAAGTVAPATP